MLRCRPAALFISTTVLLAALLGAGCPPQMLDPGDPPGGDTEPPAGSPIPGVTVSVAVVGDGQVSGAPDDAVASGSTVTLTATASPGWRFARWEGDTSGSQNPLVVTVDADRQITAVFVRTFVLSVATSGEGSVNVPAQQVVDAGETVQLVATAAPGWAFDAWQGAATGSQAALEVVVSEDMQITAVFLPTHPVTINLVGSGSVTPASGTAFKLGETVSLLATPASGWQFVRWEGAVDSASNPVEVIISGPIEVTAVFSAISPPPPPPPPPAEYVLTIHVTGDGIVTPESGTVYTSGQMATLTALPATGWRFHHWEGALTGSDNPAELTMSADREVTAVFVEARELTVTLVGEGAVTPASGSRFDVGETIELAATPGEGWVFDRWEGDLTGTANPATLVMDDDRGVTAIFTEIPREWRVTTNEDVLEIAYGNDTGGYPQYAALHTDSAYLRLVPTADSGWGTSVVLGAFWERRYTGAFWSPLPGLPEGVVPYQLRTIGTTIFARAGDALYMSSNIDVGWQKVALGLPHSVVTGLDTDGGVLYVSTDKGVAYSTNGGGTFEWLLQSSQGTVSAVDFENGTGWASIHGSGPLGGPNRKLPGGDWATLRGNMAQWASIVYIVVDPLQPAQVAYATSLQNTNWTTYRTTDGGSQWSVTPVPTIDFTGVIGGKAIAVASAAAAYSDDAGATWKPLGIAARMVIAHPTDPNLMFAAAVDGGVSVGRPGGPWYSLGLVEEGISAMGAINGRLIVANDGGGLAAVTLGSIVPQEIYRQGYPITTGTHVEGGDLVIEYSGLLSSLTLSGAIRLSPPSGQAIVAEVEGAAAGPILLANRPWEAFKPVVLSSMRISATQWDAFQAHVNNVPYSIANPGWILAPPANVALFGLTGGTSDWKTNAPSVNVQLPAAMSVTGWVTPSNNPNDDNVQFWAAANQVLENWSYTVRAFKPASP